MKDPKKEEAVVRASCNSEPEQPKWAWVALAVACYPMWLYAGCFKSLGMIYVEMLDLFNQGPVLTSLLQTVFLVFQSTTTIVGGYLSDRISLRTILLTCSALWCAGHVVTAFAPSLSVAVVGYGVITGISFGMVTTPVSSNITRLFSTRRNLVNGVMFGACSAGSLTIPFVYSASITWLTVRGTLLIVAGCALNIAMVALVLNPHRLTPLHSTVVQIMVDKAGGDRSTEGKTVELAENPKEPVVGNTAAADAEVRKTGVRQEGRQEQDQGGRQQDQGRRQQDQGGRQQDQERPLPCLVLSTKLFLVFWLVHVLSNGGYLTCLYHLPAYARQLGMSLTQRTLALALFGLTEFFGRLSLGYVGDLAWTNRFSVLCVCHLTMAASMCGLTFAPLPWTPYLIAIILGFCGGVQMSYMAPIISAAVPHKAVGTACGISLGTASMAAACLQPINGVLRADTGTYASGLRLCSGLYLAASLVSSTQGIVPSLAKTLSKIKAATHKPSPPDGAVNPAFC